MVNRCAVIFGQLVVENLALSSSVVAAAAAVL